jgi:cytosine/creatinine deaminase
MSLRQSYYGAQSFSPLELPMPDKAQILHAAIEMAVAEAKAGLAEGGIPIGAVLVKGGKVIGRGHNRRLQNQDLTAHGETECFRNAGLFDPSATTLITTLSPCRMCSGATQIAGIEHVIILDQDNYNDGQARLLEEAGIGVTIAPHRDMIRLFKAWKDDPANRETWYGDGETKKVLKAKKID